jgi:diguanylate cyclase (GGDEF)-like protein
MITQLKNTIEFFIITHNAKERMLMLLFCVGVSVATIMSPINYLYISETIGNLVLGFSCTMLVIGTLYFKNKITFKVASLLFTILTFLLFTVVFSISALIVQAIVWLYIFPIVSITLLLTKEAFLLNLLFLSTLALLMLFNIPVIPFSMIEGTIILISLITLSILIFYFVITIDKAQEVLNETSSQLISLNHSLEEKVHLRTQNLEELNQNLLNKAHKDSLTGLYNREYFFERLQEEMTRFSRYQAPCSIIFLDIDHFKKVNDTYGHIAGDTVLKELAQLLISELRTLDIIGRFGGEEFIVILPNTPIAYAHTVAEKLRQQIEQSIIIENHRITSSFGITEVGLEDDDKSLITRADKALYQAKLSGRNAVMAQLYYPSNTTT